MARIRTVKPTFFSDEKIGLLPRETRLTFLGLISAMADDHGRLSGVAKIVRGAVYPFDEDITTRDVESHLVSLSSSGLIVRYKVNGSQYIQIKNWYKHQRVDKPAASLLPPLDEHSTIVPGTIPTERNGADENGTEGSGNGREESGTEREESSAPSAPEVPLPRGAQAFVEKFYPFASDRRLKVIVQLYQTVEPAGRGARLKRGEFIRARDAEHLDRVCQAVIDDPPDDPDKAIVFLLYRLKDAPKGPSLTELAKAADIQQIALEDRYHAALQQFGKNWANEHPAEFEPIRKDVEARYRGQTGMVSRMAKETELAARCAKLGNFPSYEQWSQEHAA